jgi:hypothetical protein
LLRHESWRMSFLFLLSVQLGRDRRFVALILRSLQVDPVNARKTTTSS